MRTPILRYVWESDDTAIDRNLTEGNGRQCFEFYSIAQHQIEFVCAFVHEKEYSGSQMCFTARRV